MSAVIDIIPDSTDDKFSDVRTGKKHTEDENKCGKSLALKLSLLAINMMDHGSGSKKLESSAFLRTFFIVSSLTAYIAVYSFSLCRKFSSLALFVALYFMINQSIFWYFITKKSRRMRRLVEDISLAHEIIDHQPAKPCKGLYLVHALHIISLFFLPTLYPIVLTTIGHLRNENLTIMQKYYYALGLKTESYATTATVFFFLTLTSAMTFARDFFAVYFSCICIETKKLISDYHKKLLDESELDARALLDQYRLVFNIVREAENTLNAPLMLYFTGSLASVFISLATNFGVIQLDQTVAYRIAYHLYFIYRAFSYILVTCSAAEVHREGKRLKSAIAVRSICVDSLFESTDGRRLKELIKGTVLGYTGCDVILLTRSFVFATVGTALTYSVLVLQLQIQRKS